MRGLLLTPSTDRSRTRRRELLTNRTREICCLLRDPAT
jgi:hypothetical protein